MQLRPFEASPSHPGGRRRTGALLSLVAFASCMFSGAAVHAWDGYHSRELCLSEAIAIANDPRVDDSRHRTATSNVRHEAIESVEALLALADDQGGAGEEARAALEHLRLRLSR